MLNFVKKKTYHRITNQMPICSTAREIGTECVFPGREVVKENLIFNILPVEVASSIHALKSACIRVFILVLI